MAHPRLSKPEQLGEYDVCASLQIAFPWLRLCLARLVQQLRLSHAYALAATFGLVYVLNVYGI